MTGASCAQDSEANVSRPWTVSAGQSVAVDPIELTASAPAVDPQLPGTWRRAPDVITLIEL